VIFSQNFKAHVIPAAQFDTNCQPFVAYREHFSMSFQITLQPGSHSFPCEPDQTVLDAALKAGFLLPYGCRNGACGSCKGGVAAGVIDWGNYAGGVLSEGEKAQGKALFCKAKPCSDITIEARDVRRVGDIQIKILPTRVEQVDKVTDDVAIVRMKVPANQNFQFQAGQYLDVLLAGGKRRSFSLAVAPHDNALLELHIRHLPGGLFTEPLFTTDKVKSIWRVEGPLGSFYLREDSDKPIVFVASGTGFAPIKAIIEHANHMGVTRPMVLYWGGRRPKDLYLAHLAKAWEDKRGTFTFIPVVSDALPEDQWQGRTGFVHKAVMEDFPDLSGYQVYACGAPIVVDSARRDFVNQCKLPEDEFFADSFTIAAEAEAGFSEAAQSVPSAPAP
jgi:CDP-4-dehydro-6-deoxyglucose reductase, E3